MRDIEKIIRYLREREEKFRAFTVEDIIEKCYNSEENYDNIYFILETLNKNNYLTSDTFTKKMANKENVSVVRYYPTENLLNNDIQKIIIDIG